MIRLAHGLEPRPGVGSTHFLGAACECAGALLLRHQAAGPHEDGDHPDRDAKPRCRFPDVEAFLCARVPKAEHGLPGDVHVPDVPDGQGRGPDR